MKCTDCKYCIEEDYGYSNYTVEGTTVDCLLELNHDLPKDRWYGEDPSLDFAAKCQRFTAGKPVCIDCEHASGEIENYSDDPEVKELLIGKLQVRSYTPLTDAQNTFLKYNPDSI